MLKKLRMYLPFVNAGLQEASTYRANWLFYILGDVIGCFVSFFVWEAVFISNGGESFMEFDKGDMIVYIFLTFLTGQIIGSGGTYDIGQEIKDGTIAMRMIKPISYNSTFLFQALGNKLMEIGIIFIPLVAGVEIYRFFLTGSLQFDIAQFLLYLVCCVFAYLINFFFNISFGFTAFVFKNLWGSNLLKNCIVGFFIGQYDSACIFPRSFQKCSFCTPFRLAFIHTCYDIYGYVYRLGYSFLSRFADILVHRILGYVKTYMESGCKAPLCTGRLML